MTKTKLSRIHIIPDARFGFLKWAVKFLPGPLRDWYVRTGGVWCRDLNGNEVPGVYGKFRTQSLAIADAIVVAKRHRDPVSVVCHGKDGRFAWEHSYGKGSESPRKG